MVEYIRELAKTIDRMVNKAAESAKELGAPPLKPNIRVIFSSFVEEIDRLDPRDFEPSARARFVGHRAICRALATNQHTTSENFVKFAKRFTPLLDSYRGHGSGAVTRSFAAVKNKKIRKIIERDYAELKLRAFPDGAWKSTVILAGSILEAVLYDRLTRGPATIKKVMKATSAPKAKGGVTKDIRKHDFANQWTLSDLIRVASELNILPPENKIAIDQVLRDYRNFVHPRVEVERGVAISEGHATASKGMLEVILDELK
jgi:hypothetical protein